MNKAYLKKYSEKDNKFSDLVIRLPVPFFFQLFDRERRREYKHPIVG